jgi:hypothetical protein
MRKLVAGAAILLVILPAVAGAGDLETAYQGLKDAVAKKDTALVKRLVTELSPLVCAEVSAPAPQKEEEKEAWTNRVTYAKGVGAYVEYALFTTAMESPPAIMVDLIAMLEQENPASRYLDNAYGPYLIAMNQTGAAAKIPAVAEKAIQHFPDNEDLLAVLADLSLTRKQTDRALTYANRLVSVLSKHPRPEGVAADEWERKRSAALARGHWIAGVIQAEKGQYMAADRELRAALPAIQDNKPMLAAALFHLGMANYQLGKMTVDKARVLEGARFSERCSIIEGPYAEQARHNAIVMKTEGQRMR